MTERRIIYIAGHGRSGSTLLDLLLGAVPRIVSLGEARQLFCRGLVEGQLCGCGVPLPGCPFWGEVLGSAYGARLQSEIDIILRLQQRVDRPDRVLKTRWLSPNRYLSSFKEDVAKLTDVLERLYNAIHLATEGAVLVDSSKVPSYGHLLCGIPGWRVDVVHIVRDPRAVAFSLTRRRVRPEVHWKKEWMPTYASWRTAIRWDLINILVERLRDAANAYVRVRYEDLARNPESALREILDTLELPHAEGVELAGGLVDLAPSHTVSGNPVRMGATRLRVKPDLEWTTAMSEARKLAITALTLPLLARYEYPLSALAATSDS